MRRRQAAGAIPLDLRAFEPERWVQDAVDHDDPYLAPLVRRLSRAELFEHWYARRVIAPARYRQALWEAVGQSAGDHHFYAVRPRSPGDGRG